MMIPSLPVAAGATTLGLASFLFSSSVLPRDDVDLSKELGMGLEKIEALAAPDEATLTKVARFLEGPVETKVDRVELFSAHWKDPRRGNPRDVRIALVRLAGGARVEVAVDESGRVQGLGAWGTEDLDEDPESAWGFFLNQFTRGEISRQSLEGARPMSEADDRLAKLESRSKEDADYARALLRQRLLMRENSWRLSRLNQAVESGAIDAEGWDPEVITGFAELAELSAALAPKLGEKGAEIHHQAASQAVDYLEQGAEAFEAEDAAKARSVAGIIRTTCGMCHGSTQHQIGGKLQAAMRKERGRLVLDDGLFRVGWDVWAVPGQEELSQQLASAVRAGLMMLDAH